MNCEKCGASVMDNSIFCGKCGNKLAGENALPEKLITPATWKKRLANYVLDSIISLLFVVVVMILIVVIAALTGSESFIDSLGDSVLAIFFFAAIAVLFYYILPEYIWGKTPGKFFTDTIVVTRDGGRPDFAAVVKRTLLRLVPYEFFTFLSSRPAGLHDRGSKTLVIDDKDKI